MRSRNLVLTKQVKVTYGVRTEGGQQLGTFDEGETWRGMLELIGGGGTIIVERPNFNVVLDTLFIGEKEQPVKLVRLSPSLAEKLICNVCEGVGSTSATGTPRIPCSSCNGTGEVP